MKLILCPICGTIINLVRAEKTFCRCKRSWGQYKEDGWHATIGGEAIPIGINNHSFVEALRNRKTKVEGNNFEAWIFHHEYHRIERED
jgi:hypothetical protein